MVGLETPAPVVDYSTDLNKKNLEQDINILYNAIASTSTNKDYSATYLDIMSDSTGYDDTINTGNTTATFDTDAYVNYTTGANDSMSKNTTSAGYLAERVGIFTANSDGYISSVLAGCNDNPNGTYICEIQNASDEVIATKTVNVSAGTTFTFNFSLSDYSETLQNGQNFKVKVARGTSSQGVAGSSASGSSGSGGFTTVSGDISHGYNGTGTITFNSLSVSSGIIETNAIELDETPVYFQVFSHYSGNSLFDISFDNGTTWITNNNFNEKIEVTQPNTGQMILKFNMGGVTTESLPDYAVHIYE